MDTNAGPVLETADAVRAKRARATEAVEEALRRIERLNPALNAVIGLRAEEALAEAQALDRSTPTGRLAGVPVLVKDLEDVAGMSTRKGSVLLADAAPADRDGLAPARLRAEGAIVVGKTALPEFACAGFTASLLTGVTRNPWALDYSPGGSSGGSAAALSAGMVPIATATDGAGSIRQPAALCGLVGIKPTHNMVARRPVPDWIDLNTDGPFATTVADLRLLLDVLSGHEPGDPDVAPGQGIRGGSPHPLLPARLFLGTGFGDGLPLPRSVAAAFDQASAAFAELCGCPVEHLGVGQPIDRDELVDVWDTLVGAEHVSALGRDWVESGLDRMHPTSQDFLGDALTIGIDEYLAARRRRFDFSRVVDDLLGEDRLLVTPTVGVSGLLADDGEPHPSDPDGQIRENFYVNFLQNLTGHPAITLPAGRCGAMPFGLQVTGPRYSDAWLLDLAALWEAEHPWPRTAPGYEPFHL
ncbi:amidase [Nocardioides euryhalodurans]|uniref:Amidase n=1 Tax=Nocardioides euryhalodurans TaxID=2518370 RepID=A0A4P7GPQ0_9ACTN|nr:amidase [Nocardioides euryhalodurans]QBR93777.1 amidase [Nocardioides euryhalodurans]